ncbi:MAG: T9SS type A sorting domain-containing protein [Bacteroidota bacterium]
MTKKTIMSIALLCTVVICKSQVPNFSFENWVNFGTYLNPDKWGTMNNKTAASGIFTATQGTPGVPGNSYLKLTSHTVGGGVVNGIAVSGILDSMTLQPVSGFAYNQRPSKLTGKWQYMLSGTSAGSIHSTLTKWNPLTNSRETVATANLTLSGMVMSWANFTINYNYLTGDFPDSCIIVLKASGLTPAEGDYLWVDNLTLSGTVAGIENMTSSINKLSIYPNPTNQNLTVSLELSAPSHLSLLLTNMKGELVYAKNLGMSHGIITQNIDVSSFAKGVYFINIKTEYINETREIILQ